MRLRHSHRVSRPDDGYVLLAILFALTLLVIGLAAAAPRAATAVQREKEKELIHRGQQYRLAIRRFYKKFGRYPSNLEQLDNTNNIRFLRRRYKDPMTGKDEWELIQFGKARPARSFFGAEVKTTGGMSPAGPGFGSSTPGQSTGFSNPSSPGGLGTTIGATGPGGLSPSSSTGSAGGPPGSPSSGLSQDQLTGRTLGGGAIVGVASSSQKESLKEFEGKDHYNEWQFVYDPTMDPTLRGGVGAMPGTATNPRGGLQGSGGINPAPTSPGPMPGMPGNPPKF